MLIFLEDGDTFSGEGDRAAVLDGNEVMLLNSDNLEKIRKTMPELWKVYSDEEIKENWKNAIEEDEDWELVPEKLDKDGFATIDLEDNGDIITARVDECVLKTYKGPRPPGAIAKHLDGNKLNNAPDNLEWSEEKVA